MYEGESKQHIPKFKHAMTAPPVLKFLDPPLVYTKIYDLD